MFIQLHITAQSGPVTLVILCNSYWSLPRWDQCVRVYVCRARGAYTCQCALFRGGSPSVYVPQEVQDLEGNQGSKLVVEKHDSTLHEVVFRGEPCFFKDVDACVPVAARSPPDRKRENKKNIFLSVKVTNRRAQVRVIGSHQPCTSAIIPGCNASQDNSSGFLRLLRAYDG